MDEDKLTDIIAILMKEQRTDLIEYIQKIIDMCDFDYADECLIESSDESEGEVEDLNVNIDNEGFYSLN